MSRIKECHSEADILKLLTLSWAAIEWNHGRISDDAMRQASRRFEEAWSDDEDAPATGGTER